MAEGEYKHAEHMLKFLEKQSLEYIKRTADMISSKYPVSAPALLPKIRKIYAAKRKELRSAG